ncbi:Nucleoside diphosphate kinase 1 [Orobanche hederae]
MVITASPRRKGARPVCLDHAPHMEIVKAAQAIERQRQDALYGLCDFRRGSNYAGLSAKPFFNGLVEYIISGPVVAMVWEGRNVVTTGRKIIGATNPADSAPGTIRGDYALDIGRFCKSSIICFQIGLARVFL